MPAKAKSKKAEDAVIEKGTMAAAEPETKAAEEVLTQPKKATAKKPAARKPRAKKVKAEAEVPAEAEAPVETAPVMEQPAEEAAAEAAVSEAPAAEPAQEQAAAAQPEIEEVSEITVMPKRKFCLSHPSRPRSSRRAAWQRSSALCRRRWQPTKITTSAS